MYVYVWASMPFAYYKYVKFSMYMSSRRGSVAHTATYDGADGCSNHNYHKDVLFQKRFPFDRKIYLKDYFLLELDPPPLNAYMHIQTDMYKYMHMYFIYIHIHTHTYRYRPYTCIYTLIHAYTCIFIHIHTRPVAWNKIHQAICACIHLYVHVCVCIAMIYTYTYLYIQIHTYTRRTRKRTRAGRGGS
jgi:hypothetical protein